MIWRQLKIIRTKWGKVNTWPNGMFPSQQRRYNSFIKCWFWPGGREIRERMSPFWRVRFFLWRKQILLTLSAACYGAHFPPEAVVPGWVGEGDSFTKPVLRVLCENISVKQKRTNRVPDIVLMRERDDINFPQSITAPATVNLFTEFPCNSWIVLHKI